jgi:tetratricopeptide (TPR) repeat protein
MSTDHSMRANATPGMPAAANLEPASRSIMVRMAILFAVALVVRGVHFLAMRDSPLFAVVICDCAQYDSWAQRIAGGEWMGQEVFYQTPLYPYLLALIYSICGHSVWAVRLLQAIGGAMSCVFLARAGAQFFNERVGLLAGLLLALYPPAVFFDGILQKASLDLLLMTALLWCIGAAQQQPRSRVLVAVGMLLGAMTLNRENAAALVPVLLAWILWLTWRNSAGAIAARIAAFVVGLAIVLVPVGARNYHVGGAFLLTTAQMGPNFYIGNHRGADGGYTPMRAGRGEPGTEALDARLIAEDDLKRPLSSREVSQYWMRRSWDDICAAPVDWLRLLAWKWLLTWNAREAIDAESIQTHARYSPLLAGLRTVLHFGVICPLAVLGIWLTRREWRQLWILYAMLLTFALAVTAFYVFARYRYPLAPLAILFAAAGLAEAWNRLRRHAPGDRREVVMGLLLACGMAMVSNWPTRQVYNDDAVTLYNAGSTTMALGRTDEAMKLLEQAIEADERFPDAYNNLGAAIMRRGNDAEAQRWFERAIEISPNQAIFHTNLATSLAHQGQIDRAFEEFQKAITLDPLLFQALGPLAEIEANRGHLAEAAKYLRRAVELQKSSAAPHADLAVVLEMQGDVAQAIAELRVASQLDPELLIPRNRLAWLLATAADDRLRSGPEALAIAGDLCRAPEAPPTFLDTLAAAQAATGSFQAAAATAERAVTAAREGGQLELAQHIESRRQLYLAGKPYRGP